MIKKITFFVAAVLLASFVVNGQVETGKIYLGGSSNLSFTSTTMTPKYDGTTLDAFKTKTSSFSIEPQVGYFIMDGLAVGLDLLYGTEKSKLGDGDWSDPQTSLGVGLFGKYYYGEGKFKPFGMAHVGFMSIAYSKDDADKNSGLAFGGVLGGAYFVSDAVALELGLGYDMASLKNKDDNKAKTNVGVFGVNVGVAVTF